MLDLSKATQSLHVAQAKCLKALYNLGGGPVHKRYVVTSPGSLRDKDMGEVSSLDQLFLGDILFLCAFVSTFNMIFRILQSASPTTCVFKLNSHPLRVEGAHIKNKQK